MTEASYEKYVAEVRAHTDTLAALNAANTALAAAERRVEKLASRLSRAEELLRQAQDDCSFPMRDAIAAFLVEEKEGK